MDRDETSMVIADREALLDIFGPYRSKLDYEFFANFESEHTRSAYKNDLVQFFRFILDTFGPLRSVAELERGHVVAFRNYLQTNGGRRGKPCCPKTVIRKLAAITSYADFLIEKGLLHTNPTANIKRPRDEVITETNDLTDKQVKDLFTIIDTNKEAGHLHKAVIVVLFSTGIRKSELIHLKRSDYHENHGIKILQFIGKRGKVSRIPLHPVTCHHLEKYLEWMKSQGRELQADDWLFQPTRNRKNPNDLNKPMLPTSIDYIVKHYCRKIGISVKVSPHSARATLIGSLLESGEDLYRVSQLVNHSNVKTTQGYDKRKKDLTNSPVFRLKFF